MGIGLLNATERAGLAPNFGGVMLLLAVFGLSVAAGILLWRPTELGRRLSRLLLLLQVPQFSVGGWLYEYSVGFKLVIGLEVANTPDTPATFLLNVFPGSSFQLVSVPADGPVVLGINVIALVGFCLLAGRLNDEGA